MPRLKISYRHINLLIGDHEAKAMGEADPIFAEKFIEYQMILAPG